MWEDFFNHTCNIYHLTSEATSPGYGLPESPKHSYPSAPDISGLECHFGVKSAAISVTQGAPANELDSRIKLAVPLGTDIRINDKIINCDTGYEYTAEQPVQVQEHHIFAYIHRIDRQKEL